MTARVIRASLLPSNFMRILMLAPFLGGLSILSAICLVFVLAGDRPGWEVIAFVPVAMILGWILGAPSAAVGAVAWGAVSPHIRGAAARVSVCAGIGALAGAMMFPVTAHGLSVLFSNDSSQTLIVDVLIGVWAGAWGSPVACPWRDPRSVAETHSGM